MLVYRDGQQEVDSEAAQHELGRVIEAMGDPDSDGCLEALLRAAELECALSDLASHQALAAQQLTSDLAEYWLSERGEGSARPDAARARAFELPPRVALRRPEGYAYYGLNPRSYAKLARTLEPQGRPVCVIGIRSIGTSLSAIVCAALRGRGTPAERITVRPSGHPWARELRFGPEQERFVRERSCDGADFVIADEGPGLSGSTLLSVAEALTRAGVERDRVTLFCSRAFDPVHLIADRAGARWQFRTLVAESLAPPDGAQDLSAGGWRSSVYAAPDEWPPSWTSRERIKFRLLDSDEIVKFEGYPPYDAGPGRRAELLCEAGFGSRARPLEPGFVAHAWCPGRPARPSDVSEALIRRLASYLAFRSRELSCAQSSSGDLERMTAVNLSEALGTELPTGFSLPIEVPVVADGKMQPHEFVIGPDAPLVKVDGVDHGDDHLFPGPTDIAWDVAGAAVEWQLDPHGIGALLRHYQRETGDDVSSRFNAYVLAYCAFQLGCVSFALRGAAAAEQRRLEAARAGYERDLLAGLGFAHRRPGSGSARRR